MKAQGEKAEKIKYWAKRLECPVDEDAGYHNTFVSRADCHTNASIDLLTLNSGATEISFPSLQTGEHGHGKATRVTGS